MYLRKNEAKNTGRTYQSIVETYRDKETKKIRSRTIQSLGYLDELIKDYPDPIKHFEKVIEEMKRDKADKKVDISIKYKPSDKLSVATNNHKNFAMLPLVLSIMPLRLINFQLTDNVLLK